MVNQLRCVVHGQDKDGLLQFSRSHPRLLTDSGIEKRKIQDWAKARKKELEDWAVLKLQAAWLGFRDRRVAKVLLRKHRSCIRIQCFVRGFLGRQAARKKRFRHTHGALTIQRLFRGYQGRCKWNHYFKTRTAGVYTLQRVARGRLGRRRWNSIHAEMSHAATKIQGGWRGMQSRRATKKRIIDRDHAIRMLQRVYRGHQGKKKFWAMHAFKTAAVRVIQHNVRSWMIGHLVDKRIAGKKHLASVMQRVGRGFLYGRKVAQQLRFERDTDAAIVIQGLIRGRMGRKKWTAELQDVSATKIASLYRCKVARTEVNTRRVNRLR